MNHPFIASGIGCTALVLVALALFLPQAASNAAEPEKTDPVVAAKLAQLVAEYDESIVSLRQPLENLRVRGVRRDTAVENDVQLKDASVQVTIFVMKDDIQCVHSRYQNSGPDNAREERVFSSSGTYAFQLDRMVDQKPYVIKRVRFTNETPNSDESQRTTQATMQSHARVFTDATYRFVDVSVADLLAEKNFDITEIEDVDGEGQGTDSRIRVNFKILEGDFAPGTGHVILDPAFSLAISEFHLHNAGAEVLRIINGKVACRRWGMTGEIFPELASIQTRIEPNRSSEHAEFLKEMRFTEVEPGAVTPAQFTLAAYNVPEVARPGLEPSRRRWLLMAANAVLFVAGALWLLFRRKNRKPSAG